MTGKPTRQAGAALPVRPLAARTATQRTRPLDDQSPACSQEASTMTKLCNRSRADNGAPVIGRVLSSAGRETPGMRAGLRWPGGGS